MMVKPNIPVRHVHFNNAGASPSPPDVTNAIIEHLNLESQMGGYRAAELKSTNVDGVYVSVARLIGAGCIDDDDTSSRFDDAQTETTYNPRDEIALVESATVGWTRAFYSMLETKERELLATQTTKMSAVEKEEELVILVSEAEYAANLVAAVKFARDHSMYTKRFRWKVFAIPSTTTQQSMCDGDHVSSSTGVVDLEAFQSMLSGTYTIKDTFSDDERYLDPSSIVMVCITHIPTNAGIINPVNEIGSLINNYNCRERGAELNDDNTKLPYIMYLVDACQSVGQIQVNVRDMQCHALASTGRKYLRGPRGTGFLFVQKNIANMLEPSHIDHAAAPVVKMPSISSSWEHGLEEESSEFGLYHTYQPGAARFEFWESNVSNRLGLGAAIDLSLNIGMDTIEKKCTSLGKLLRQKLGSIEGVHVYHDDSTSSGIVTFSVDKLDATIIKERMQTGLVGKDFANEEYSLCCFHLSVVPATSTPLDSSCTGLGEKRLLRASLSYFNTEDEITLFCKALTRVMG